MRRFAGRNQAELDYFRALPTLREVVIKATMAIGPDGKMYAHQRRVGHNILSKAKDELVSRLTAIESCESFDGLLQLIERSTEEIDRFGKLASYDTSLRIGAWLGLMPEVVYLHAGTRDGAAELGFGRGKHYLEMSELPDQLQHLEPREVEDVLCIFKDNLRGAIKNLGRSSFYVQRTRCK